jgi:DNA-binding NtrC family response regulator
LIADKNRHLLDFLLGELTAEGYEVRIARDARQILEEIAAGDPVDLLIFDLEIPGIDNSKIIEVAQTRRPPLPVIIHTFLTDESARDTAGTDEIYIQKSGNIDRLKKAIEDTVQKYYPDRLELPRPQSV